MPRGHEVGSTAIHLARLRRVRSRTCTFPRHADFVHRVFPRLPRYTAACLHSTCTTPATLICTSASVASLTTTPTPCLKRRARELEQLLLFQSHALPCGSHPALVLSRACSFKQQERSSHSRRLEASWNAHSKAQAAALCFSTKANASATTPLLLR